MTIEEFDRTGWSGGMSAKYHSDNEVYPIGSCDFEEKLVGLLGVIASQPDELSWVRCENVTLIKSNASGEGRRSEDAVFTDEG